MNEATALSNPVFFLPQRGVYPESAEGLGTSIDVHTIVPVRRSALSAAALD